MSRRLSGEQGYSGYPSKMITVMLTLERPSTEQLTKYNRAQKYAMLKSSASEIRTQLVRWIDENGLSDDVARVGEPTVFNTLFVTSTPGVAEQLGKAPGVVGVAPAGEFEIDLLSTPEEETSTTESDADQEGF